MGNTSHPIACRYNIFGDVMRFLLLILTPLMISLAPKETPLRMYTEVDITLKCTIQIVYIEDGWEVYKTVDKYPVNIYQVETSRYGHTTYKGYANHRFISVDSSACETLGVQN